MRRIGLTGLFFESEEPELADLPLEDWLELFPEGDYRFVGRTVEGDELVGTATFTHNIPNGPLILSPQEGEEVDPTDVTISWQAVTSPPGTEIAGYQVIVEQGDAINVLDIKVPASVTGLTIPLNSSRLARSTTSRFWLSRSEETRRSLRAPSRRSSAASVLVAGSRRGLRRLSPQVAAGRQISFGRPPCRPRGPSAR